MRKELSRKSISAILHITAGVRAIIHKGVEKTTKKLPLTITIHGDDLDEKIREQLDAVFRQRTKKKRLNYDKLSSNGQVTFEVSCRISSA